jgi:Flp pilus assembly protein CpaB
MVLTGLLAFLLTYAALRDDIDDVEVAVAAADLRAGAPLEMSMLVATRVPLIDGASPLGVMSISEAESAIADGAWIASPVPGGSLVRSSEVTRGPVERSRAMALSIDRAHAVDGALDPGDLVDVVLVEGGSARFALAGLRVLAVSDSGAGSSRSVVLTVEVDAASSLRLAYAMSMGNLHVVRATGSAPAMLSVRYPAPPTVEGDPDA